MEAFDNFGQVELQHSAHVGFLIQVGPSMCIRCKFKTNDELPRDMQNDQIMQHLTEFHPNWLEEPQTGLTDLDKEKEN